MSMEDLSVPQTTKSGPSAAMSLRPRLKRQIQCARCEKDAMVATRGAMTTKFCSRQCVLKERHSDPQAGIKLSKAFTKPRVPKTCEWCGETFLVQNYQKDIRRICGASCVARWRMSLPGAAEAAAKRMRVFPHPMLGTKWPSFAKRMRENNPMKDPKTRQKVADALAGRPFPTERGGNGKISVPQKLLAE